MNETEGGGRAEQLLSHGFFPDGTELQERVLRTRADILIGDRCQIQYGLHGENIAICEFCRVKGPIRAEGDLRIDNFTEVEGDVIVEQDAYLGEGVKIRGRLTVLGDMDIGDNVQIEKGFEAKGWIVIRNPLPVIVYLFLYLMALLHLEREEELEKFFRALEEEGDRAPLILPPRTTLTPEGLELPSPFSAGSGCRLHGLIRADGVEIGEKTVHFGSIRSSNHVRIGAGTEVHGEVASPGRIEIGKGAHVMGNVTGAMLELHEDARVDGLIRAGEWVRIRREE